MAAAGLFFRFYITPEKNFIDVLISELFKF